MKWGFFKFDKSRSIIFIILVLLYPFTIVYPRIRGEIFSPNSRVCLAAIDYKVFSTILGIPFMFIDYFFYYKYVNPLYIIWSLSQLIPSVIISLVLSYPLNLLYKKFFKKSPRQQRPFRHNFPRSTSQARCVEQACHTLYVIFVPP